MRLGRSRVSRTSVVVIAVAALASTASCSSGHSGGGSSDNGAVKIMLIAPLSSSTAPNVYPEAQTAIEALVNTTNAEHALGSRKLEVTSCNDKGDPNDADNCARSAVSGKYVAVIGGDTLYASTFAPILAAADIPYTGYVFSSAENQVKTSFPLDGLFVTYPAVAQVLANDGCKAVGIISADNAPGHSATKQVEKVLESRHVTVLPPKYVAPTGVPDYSPVLAAESTADCVAPLIGAAEVVKLMTAIHQSGRTIQVATGSNAYKASVAAQLGSVGNGVQVISFVRGATTDNPQVKTALAAIEKQGNGAKGLDDDTALSTWAEGQLIVDVLKTLSGDITASKVLAGLDALKTVDLGIYAPIDFTKNLHLKDYPRFWNYSVFVYKSENGKLELAQPNPIDVKASVKASLS